MGLLFNSALLVGGGICYTIYLVGRRINDEYGHELKHLRGPKATSMFFGNFMELMAEGKGDLPVKWLKEHGKTFKLSSLCGLSLLWTSDPKALAYILKNDEDYQKSEGNRYGLGRLIGNGLVVMEGEKHKLQRRVMNPAFGPAQVRELTEVFVEKSMKLRNAWSKVVDAGKGTGHVEVISWLSKMTLDVIGETGFHYSFNALDDEANELNVAYEKIFRRDFPKGFLAYFIISYDVLRESIPSARKYLPELDKDLVRAREIASQTGRRLLDESKAALNQTEEKTRKRDLLSLLVRSNVNTDGQHMDDEDVLAQVPTFLIAGHETTSTAVTFMLLLLTDYPDKQRKLREELQTVSTDNPSMDELNSLPYLDAVVREALRLWPPVEGTGRQAMKDDIIPLSTPITDKNGVVHESIHIKKGTNIFVPIMSINHDKELWGEDANEFRPERWESVPEAVAAIPAVFGNMLTFLGGPHACIGWRFALVEMKALVFTLIRGFEFELDPEVSKEDLIIKKSFIVQRPGFKGESGPRLPLMIRHAS